MKRYALSGTSSFEANTLSTVLVHPALAPAILSIYLIYDGGNTSNDTLDTFQCVLSFHLCI